MTRMTGFGATAVGIANIAHDGTVLDTWYPEPEIVPPGQVEFSSTTRLGAADIPQSMLQLVGLDEHRLVEHVAVRTNIADLSAEPIDAHDVYLRLHLLSHRLVRPLEINLDGGLAKLSTVVWTNKGPALPDNFEAMRTSMRSRGLIHVYGIEKLPRMVDYVVPSGVSIAEAERVRLGAYLAPGTQVVREGYVSYNAGSLGPARIEGQLTSASVIGTGTDIGLSAAVLADRRPTGLREPIRIGENCKLGVGSALVGIHMGDSCSIGPSIVIDKDTELYDVVLDQPITGAQLSGQSHWHVRNEAGRDTPVVRWSPPADRWAR